MNEWFSEETDQVAANLLPAIGESIPGFDAMPVMEQAGALRHWVYSNSVMEAYIEGTGGQYDTADVLSRLSAAAQKKSKAPQLICGPRALALAALFKNLGLQVRFVHIFSDDYSEVRSHTYLEYYDPDSKGWVVEDPTFDVSYVDQSGHRIETSRIVFDRIDVTPMGWSNQAGWEENGVRHLDDHFFEAMMITNDWNFDDIILVNPLKFNIRKPLIPTKARWTS